MAAIIKKQILKHLSKFARNLSAESINLSTLKGEGEVYNLDFDCVAIQNLLNLPTWLKINHASCNKVTVKIPWTKTSTSPVTIILDSVDVMMSTCEKPRDPNGPSPIQDSASGGDTSYGSIQRILEGIALRIDSINVDFTSTVFTASFQLSQLVVYSTDPNGNNADLRMTRIVNKQLKQVLTFKKISWQTMRIELRAMGDGSGACPTTRLITNKASLSITLRRKTSDLSLIASRLHIEFDDLQWIFTIEQLQSAMLCVKSLNDIIERSLAQSKINNESQQPATNFSSTTTSSASSGVENNIKGNEEFHKHLIHESSFHFDLDKINLVIADDGRLFEYHQKNGCSPIVEGGALLVALSNLKIDHYPSHHAGKSRRHFRFYDETMESRDRWADEIITRFTQDYLQLKKNAKLKGFKTPPSSSKLMESCSILRLGDIEVEQVTSSCKKDDDAFSDLKLMTSQRKLLHLPDEMKFFSVNLTDYFYPDNRDYPAPHSNIFIRVNAPVFLLDWKSLKWINLLMTSTLNSVQQVLRHLGLHTDDVINSDETEHVDVRMETLMPKIIIPSPEPLKEEIEKSENYKKRDFPDGIEIQISELSVSNCRSGRNCSVHYLHSVLGSFQQTFLNKNSEECFPHKPGDEQRTSTSYDLLRHHANDVNLPITNSMKQNTPLMNGKSLKCAARDDVWSLWVRQLWVDVITCDRDDGDVTTTTTSPLRHNKKKKMKFENRQIVDSFPLTVWTSFVLDDGLCDVITTSGDADDVTSSKEAGDEVESSKEGCGDATDDVIASAGCDVTSKSREERRKNLMNFYKNDHNLPLEGVGSAEKENKPEEEKENEETKKRKITDISVLVHSDKTLKLKIDHFEFVYLQRLMENVQKITEALTNDVTIILGDDDSSSIQTETRIFLKFLIPKLQLFIVLKEIDDDEENDEISQTSSYNSITQALADRFGTPSYQQQRHNDDEVASVDNSDVISIFGGDTSSVTSLAHQQQPTRSFTFPSSQTPPETQQQQPAANKRSQTPSSGGKISSLWRNRGENLKFFHNKPHLRTSTTFLHQHNRSPSSSICDDASSTDDVTTHHHPDDVTSVNSLEQFVVLDLEERNSLSSHCSFEQEKITNEKSASHETTRRELTSSASSSHDDVSIMRDSVTTVTSSPNHDHVVTSPPTRHLMRRKEKMSLVCLEVDENVEMFLDLNENSSNIKLVLHQIEVKQLGNFNKNTNIFTSQSVSKKLDEFSPTKKKEEKSKPSFHKAQIKIRVEEKNKIQNIKIKAENIQQDLFTSTLNHLGVFIENERLVEVVPMLEIEARNIEVGIHDDMKGEHVKNVGNKPPVNLYLHHVSLHTDQHGRFIVNSLNAGDETKKPQLESTPSHTSLGDDVTSSTSSRNQLEEELVLVKHERDSLYAAIKMMQDDLMKSEKERSRLHQKLLILQQQQQN